MTTAGALPETLSRGPASSRRPAAIGRRDARGERLRNAMVVGLPTLLAAVLCLYELTTRSLWLDEAATVAIASQHGAAFGSALAHDGGNMLGYYGLLHVLIGLFGSGALVLRLPSVVAAVSTVTLVGLLGLRLFDRRAALLAGTLTAVSLSLVYWGQDARGYAPMIALITGSFLAFVALLDGHSGWRAWLAYVVVTVAAVYAGLEAVLVVPAQLLMLLWHRERWRTVLSAVATTAVCFVPLAVLAASRGSGQLFWVPPPSARILDQVLQALTSSGLQPAFYTSTSTALLVLTLVVLGLGAGLIWRLWRVDRAAAAGGPTLVLGWLLLPAIVALLESTVGQSIFQARYLLVSLPAVSLFLGWTIVQLPAPRLLVLGVVAALVVLRALQLAPAYGSSPENWRAATAYVLAHTRSGDCAAFYPLDNRQAFRYYLPAGTRAPQPILPSLPWRQVRPFVEDYSSLSPAQLAGLSGHCGRVWLIASHEGRSGGPPISHRNYLRFVALVNGLQARYPTSRTSSFGADRVVTVTLYSR
jgi:mannosyltransferase